MHGDRGVGASTTAVGVEAGREPLWRLVVALTAVMGITTISLPLISVLGPFLTQDFDISRTTLGWFATGASLTGAAVSPFAGRAIDVVGYRRGSTWAFLGGAGALLLVLGAVDLWVVGAVALILGAINGLGNPITNRLIADCVPHDHQGLVTSIKQSGVQISALVIGFALPAVAGLLGWRGAAAAFAALPLAGLVWTLWVLPPDRSATDAADGPPPAARRPRSGQLGWLTLYGFFMGAGASALISFLPVFATDALGLGTGPAGALVGVVGALGFVARLTWGPVAGRTGAFRMVLGGLALSSIVAAAAAALAPSVGTWLVWPAAILGGATAVAWNPVGMLLIIVAEPVDSVGRASGLVVTGFMLGLAASPVVVGATIDRAGYVPAWWGVAALFVGALATMAGARAAGPVVRPS